MATILYQFVPKGSGGLKTGTIIGYIWGLYRDSYRDPLTRSPCSTSKYNLGLTASNYRITQYDKSRLGDGKVGGRR